MGAEECASHYSGIVDQVAAEARWTVRNRVERLAAVRLVHDAVTETLDAMHSVPLRHTATVPP